MKKSKQLRAAELVFRKFLHDWRDAKDKQAMKEKRAKAQREARRAGA